MNSQQAAEPPESSLLPSCSSSSEEEEEEEDPSDSSTESSSSSRCILVTTTPQHCHHSATYTLDILTDGSEQSGPPNLFLSVYKPNTVETTANLSSTCSASPFSSSTSSAAASIASYALHGLGGLLARTATDQRYKLHPVQAVILPHTNMQHLQGLAALLSILQQAGKPQLTVVAPIHMATRTEQLVQTVHKHQPYPVVRIGRIPANPDTASSANDGTAITNSGSNNAWWCVYQDEHVVVHAQWSERRSSLAKGNKDDETCSSLVYLYTLRKLDPDHSRTLLVVNNDTIRTEWDNLPLDLDTDRPLKILAGVQVVDTSLTTTSTHDGKDIPNNNKTTVFPWYTVAPRSSSSVTIEPNLLVRAQEQSRIFHQALPQSFPWPNTTRTATENNNHATCTQRLLHTGDRLVLSPLKMFKTNRLENVLQTTETTTTATSTTTSSSNRIAIQQEWPQKLQRFLQPHDEEAKDENEIDLEDAFSSSDENDIDDQEQQPSFPQLLVLGTGCAAPSPHRGASGHVVFLEPQTALVFEVGEGFVTQWNRYAQGRPLGWIQLVWISHAHLDHYGGLVNLLVCLHRERQQQQQTPTTSTTTAAAASDNDDNNKDPRRPAKRGRHSYHHDYPRGVPALIAPRRVLQYLALFFPEPSEYFRGAEQSQCAQTAALYKSIPSIAFWQDVRVEHSCYHAYGFVAGLDTATSTTGNRDGQQQRQLVLCFSGDTVPCQRLVDACRRRRRVQFLIHEATFDESETEMSAQKKHSTIDQALRVAKDIGAERTLLTHFSQRYDTIPTRDLDGSVGFALDGMLIAL